MWIIIVLTFKWRPDGCLLRVSFTQLKVICSCYTGLRMYPWSSVKMMFKLEFVWCLFFFFNYLLLNVKDLSCKDIGSGVHQRKTVFILFANSALFLAFTELFLFSSHRIKDECIAFFLYQSLIFRPVIWPECLGWRAEQTPPEFR